jgi:hypothetical protein
MVRARPIFAMAVALPAGLSLIFAAPPALAKDGSFATPSRNVVCRYFSTGGPGPYIRCDLLSLNDVGFLLDRRHKAKRVRVTDTVADPQRVGVLRYGNARRDGPFRCRSRQSGLTCRSSVGGHGFELSRQRQRLF